MWPTRWNVVGFSKYVLFTKSIPQQCITQIVQLDKRSQDVSYQPETRKTYSQVSLLTFTPLFPSYLCVIPLYETANLVFRSKQQEIETATKASGHIVSLAYLHHTL